MPTVPSIRTSVENQSVLVLDEHAKNGIFRRDARDRLIAYTGGFSVVFPYEAANGEKWAFRCWHSDVNNSQRRYEIISDAIQKAQLDFLCEFEYTEKGINVEGRIYPTTRMRWVDGITIKDYIYQNRQSKQLLEKLAENFLSMTRTMHRMSFAHGDLQHGNILVNNKHQLFLVDYDSFYCQELYGEADNVTGLPDYQHPSRVKNRKVSEKLDYFSELIIYLSLIAISLDPNLAVKYRINDADRLLFEAKDYEDLKKSNIYKDLRNLNDNNVDNLIKILEDYLLKPSIDDLSPFEELLSQMELVFEIDKNVIRKGIDSAVVSWSVHDARSVVLKDDNDNVISEDIKGCIKVSPDQSTEYSIKATLRDGSSISKMLFLKVSEGAIIKFSSDKLYVFPGIPFTIKWDVKNAKSVKLDGDSVDSSGSFTIIGGIEEDTTYKLEVEDDFGNQDLLLKVSILPIPVVKMHVNPPVFKSSIILNHGISASAMALSKTPELPKLQVKIPFVETANLNMELPHFVNLKLPNETLWHRIKCSFNDAWNSIKNKIKNKLK
ncbi:MAG: AarF/UbiB family protein [Bacteroidales bacterium]|nr:AarF/UbiB family protein [Bacteroidales bacterium]